MTSRADAFLVRISVARSLRAHEAEVTAAGLHCARDGLGRGANGLTTHRGGAGEASARYPQERPPAVLRVHD